MTYNIAKITFKAAKEKLNNDLEKSFTTFLADGERLPFKIREKLAYANFRDEVRKIRWKIDRFYFEGGIKK